jgi:hypothetical protein
MSQSTGLAHNATSLHSECLVLFCPLAAPPTPPLAIPNSTSLDMSTLGKSLGSL